MDKNPYEVPQEKPVDRPPAGRRTNWKWVGIALLLTAALLFLFFLLLPSPRSRGT